ncbi:MAG: M28 family peptidase [Bacteroidales bacterium]|nr:M28 family peptidase [Bacteroidales bacterium]
MKHLIMAFFLSTFFVGCKSASTPVAVASVATSAFSADSAFSYVASQVAFGPRIPGSKAHLDCSVYLKNTLAKFADSVIMQPFSARSWDGKTLQGVNIIASFNPSATGRILLCAHWDSRPYADNENNTSLHRSPIDGANDGASGVAVLLEVARVLSTSKGVDIVLFDLEDSGKPRFEVSQYGDEKSWCLGSQYWASHPHTNRISFGILLDMVGVAGARFMQEGTSLYYAADVLDKVWATAATMGYGQFFVYEKAGAIIDDHLFINQIAGIPTIDIISLDGSTRSGFFKHWHTLQDNISNIDKSSLKMVGDVVLEVVGK